MPLPVLVEVVVGDDGAEPEDGLGSGGAPAGAGDVHPVLDQVPCCAFDDAGGDLPAAVQGGGVVQVGGLAGEVGGRLVGAGAFAAAEAGFVGLVSDCGGGIDRAAGQDGAGLVGDPGLGVTVAGVEERPGGLP